MPAHWIYASILSLLLAACGGGGGSTPEAGAGTNNPPTTDNPSSPGSAPDPAPSDPDDPAPPSSGGGGGNDGSGGSDGGTGSPPPVEPPPASGGNDSGSGGGGGDDPAAPPPESTFTAQLASAPADGFLDDYAEGTHPDDTVRFMVSGTGLRNVELVSANNVSIKYGTFTISADGTRAALDWSYKSFGYLYFDLRILAWNVPAGEAGEGIEVMPATRYTRRPSPGMCAEYYRRTGSNSCGEVAP